jgi:hypothetical protein
MISASASSLLCITSGPKRVEGYAEGHIRAGIRCRGSRVLFRKPEGLGRVGPIIAVSVVTAALLSGCQGDGDPSANETSDRPSASSAPASPSASPSALTTPEPSPASSAGPAANLPLPVKTALADENTAEGLEAFTNYWFELFSYGYETNDWAAFEAVTDQGCGTCRNVIAAVNEIYNSGGWVSGAQSKVSAFSTDFRTNTQGSVSSFVEVVQSQTKTFDKSGVSAGEDAAKDPSTNVTFAFFDEDKWLMLDFGPPEGTG